MYINKLKKLWLSIPDMGKSLILWLIIILTSVYLYHGPEAFNSEQSEEYPYQVIY